VNVVFRVEPKSGVPIYVQLMDQIKHLIATGTLQPGQQLPTIRELAVDLAVNLHTVAHAYAELEREGFLTVQRGRGTFITDGHSILELGDLRSHKLQSLVDGLFTEALNLGYGPDDIVQALVTQAEQWRHTTQHPAEDVERG
jgi:GntR family transcriptional regulator